MRRLAFLVGAALTVGGGVLIGAACGDSGDGSTFPGGNTKDSGFTDSQGFCTVATNDGAVGQPACSPSLPATFKENFTAPTKADPAPCTTDDFGQYFDACLGVSDPQGKACKDWLAAHANCAQCIESPTSTTAFQSYGERIYLAANVAGCIALARGDDTCAKAYDTYTQCRRASCVDCFGSGDKTCTDNDACRARFDTCQTNASCQNFDNTRRTACTGDAGLSNTPCDQTADEKSGLGSQDAGAILAADKSWLVRLMGVFCGP